MPHALWHESKNSGDNFRDTKQSVACISRLTQFNRYGPGKTEQLWMLFLIASRATIRGQGTPTTGEGAPPTPLPHTKFCLPKNGEIKFIACLTALFSWANSKKQIKFVCLREWVLHQKLKWIETGWLADKTAGTPPSLCGGVAAGYRSSCVWSPKLPGKEVKTENKKTQWICEFELKPTINLWNVQQIGDKCGSWNRPPNYINFK